MLEETSERVKLLEKGQTEETRDHQLNIDCHICRLLYMNLMVITNQKAIINKKIIKRKEIKYITKENHQITREESKRRRKEQKRTTKNPEKK